MTAVSAETGTAHPPLTAVPPGERGALTVADRVVAKIAAQAAREALAPLAAQAAREALAPLPADAAAPHATVVVHHDSARVRVHLELGYPGDIGARCAAVRRRVVERVDALLDLKVPEVAVRVERLHPAPAPGAPHGRIT
ncbi:Asp23/Gls24 family envelope stress response protein [Streptomyces collinus]|uniref:Asp23/Gls24 family envelope stress response protein n=1 Tax=Streptomyces collinus TaxID=42684 RepID=UPI003322929A